MAVRFNRGFIKDDPALIAMGLLPNRSAAMQDAGEQSTHSSSWRSAWILLFVCLVALGGIFWPTVNEIVRVWYNSSTFNHGFLILPVVGYLIWIRRGALANRTPSPSWYGVAMLVLASFCWLLGEFGSVSLVRQFSLALMVQALFVAILGIRIARVLAFPLGYLLFAVPFGEFLVPPLQDLTAIFVVKGLGLLNIPVFFEGVFISIPTGTFKVAEACSGVRFLIATIALGTLFAHLTYRSRVRKLIFMCLTVAVPIVANGFRAFGIVLIAYYTDNRFAVGVDHLIYGWIFFAIVTVILLALGMTFRDEAPHPEDADPAIRKSLASHIPGKKKTVLAALACLAVATTGPAYAYVVLGRDAGSVSGPLPVPVVGGGWALLGETPHEWMPNFVGAHAVLRRTYEKSGQRVDMYIAYYLTQREGAELVSANNSVAGGTKLWQRAAGGKSTARVDGESLRIERQRFLYRGDRRLTYHWYWVANRFTGDHRIAKALQAFGRLFGWNESAAIIAVSAPYAEIPKEADDQLRDFLRNLHSMSSLLERYSHAR